MTGESDSEIYDAAVVGAGPAGSACAIVLARAGIRVLLCDKSVFPRSKICGETVNPRCWAAFDALGVAEEIGRHLRTRIGTVAVTNKAGKEIRAQTKRDPMRPFFSMGRDTLDSVLAGAAVRAGVEFRDGAAVVGVTWDDYWRIEIRDRRSAETDKFAARYLVGADGRNSIVAGSLTRMGGGDRRATKHRRDDERVGVQWHTNLDTRFAGVLHMFLFDAGYCGLVDVDDRHTNVSMVTTPAIAAVAKTDFRGFLNRTVWSNPVAARRFPDLSPIGEITTTSPINPRRNRCDHPHAVLAGDAAQTVEPFTGEGIRCALEDGIATAEHLIRKRQGKKAGAPATPDRFRVNGVFSPILRRPQVRDGLVSLGARFPVLSRWVVGSVMSARSVKSRERQPARHANPRR
jgi:flavin-dependent dehydrogenase